MLGTTQGALLLGLRLLIKVGPCLEMSVAAKRGAISAGETGPVVWLRYGLWQYVEGAEFDLTCAGHQAELPYGNFSCPAATALSACRVGVAEGLIIIVRSVRWSQGKSSRRA